MLTLASLITCYLLIESLLSGTKCVFKRQHLQMFGLKLSKYKVIVTHSGVDHGSERQLQLGGQFKATQSC